MHFKHKKNFNVTPAKTENEKNGCILDYVNVSLLRIVRVDRLHENVGWCNNLLYIPSSFFLFWFSKPINPLASCTREYSSLSCNSFFSSLFFYVCAFRFIQFMLFAHFLWVLCNSGFFKCARRICLSYLLTKTGCFQSFKSLVK